MGNPSILVVLLGEAAPPAAEGAFSKAGSEEGTATLEVGSEEAPVASAVTGESPLLGDDRVWPPAITKVNR